ncbi:MAG: leucine-rich repeat protein [Treponema sp.]|jgi:hypothetical protein|nr:leucine-rich repeat protein [Treponema sp.]
MKKKLTALRSLAYILILCFVAQRLTAQDRGIKVVAAEHLGEAQIGKQYALFIAIDGYHAWPALKKPVTDAQEIRTILHEHYYIDEFIELYNADATRANIARTFIDLQGRLTIYDSLFIYYAGHGYVDPGSQQGFWIPVNAGLDEYEQDNWLPNSAIRGYIAGLKTIHVFMVSDACFSGDILNADRARPATIDNAYFRHAYSLVSRLVLTSGSNETVPDESEFSQALKMCLLKNTAPLLDPYGIHNDVRLAVRKTTPLLGSLERASHQDGATFILFRRPLQTSSTPSQAATLLQAASAPQTAPPPADWTPAKDFDLGLGERGVTITGYKGKAAMVNIPAVIDGSPVVEIGEKAFYDCRDLRSITIPSSVTSIGERAFRGCSGLNSITVPSSVTSIGGSAFSGCSGLRSIAIPSSVTSIGDGAFYGCWNLSSIMVDALNTRYSAANGVLFNKDNKTLVCYPKGKVYTSYTIPSSVTSIGDGAFDNCWNLRSITIPSSVTSIGERAFSGCSGLRSITIPSSVTSIGERAFYGCSNLSSIAIPSSVTSIGAWAFYGCSGLSSISIPSSVTSIGGSAFHGCSGLSSITVDTLNTRYSATDGVLFSKDNKTLVCYPKGKVYTSYTIPSSVTSIGAYAFYGCSGLSSITIPNSVTSIGYDAFHNCSGLRSITIPSSVTSIGREAFRGCNGLRSITIPSSVTSIGNGAFRDCSGLSAESREAIRRRFGSGVF